MRDSDLAGNWCCWWSLLNGLNNAIHLWAERLRAQYKCSLVKIDFGCCPIYHTCQELDGKVMSCDTFRSQHAQCESGINRSEQSFSKMLSVSRMWLGSRFLALQSLVILPSSCMHSSNMRLKWLYASFPRSLEKTEQRSLQRVSSSDALPGFLALRCLTALPNSRMHAANLNLYSNNIHFSKIALREIHLRWLSRDRIVQKDIAVYRWATWWLCIGQESDTIEIWLVFSIRHGRNSKAHVTSCSISSQCEFWVAVDQTNSSWS